MINGYREWFFEGHHPTFSVMNILFVTENYPDPPLEGDSVISYNWIRELSLHHEVHLLSFDLARSQGTDKTWASYLKSHTVVPFTRRRYFTGVIDNIVKNRPFSFRRFDFPSLTQHVYRIVHGELIESIVCIGSNMFGLAECIAGQEVPTVLHAIDSLPLKLERRQCETIMSRLHHWREKRSWVSSYKSLASSFDQIVFVDEVSKRSFLESTPNMSEQRVHVISNGVNTDYFHPQTKQQRHRQSGQYLVFHGNMSSQQTKAAVEVFCNVFLRLKETHPKLKGLLVGRNPSPIVQKCAENHEDIIVTGEVEDVRPFLWQATVYLAPMVSGVGIKNRVLEAMACGCPVVGTPYAFEALPASNEAYIECRSINAIPAVVNDLLVNTHKSCYMREQATDYVQKHFSWRSKVEQLEKLIQRSSS